MLKLNGGQSILSLTQELVWVKTGRMLYDVSGQTHTRQAKSRHVLQHTFNMRLCYYGNFARHSENEWIFIHDFEQIFPCIIWWVNFDNFNFQITECAEAKQTYIEWKWKPIIVQSVLSLWMWNVFTLWTKRYKLNAFRVQLPKIIEIERDDVRLSCWYSLIQRKILTTHGVWYIRYIFDHLSLGILRRCDKVEKKSVLCMVCALNELTWQFLIFFVSW